MLGPDCYLSFDQERLSLVKNWVGIKIERVINVTVYTRNSLHNDPD